MSEQTFNQVTRNKAVRSVSLSLRDLEGLAKIVHDRNQQAVQLEQSFIQSLNAGVEDKKTYIQMVSDNQKMTIFINGAEGDNLIAYDPSCFQSHMLPVGITSVTIETQTYRQVQGQPANSVRIHLDFSKMKFSSPQFTNDGTLLNISSLQVVGNNEAWVTSTFKALEDRFRAVRNARSLLHAPGAYVIGLIFVVFPTLIFLIDETYRRHQIFFDSFGIIWRLGAVAYAFLFGLITYRLLFNYGLWAFPSVELINERDISAKHRKFWFSAVTSLLLGAISYYLYKSGG